MVGGLTVWQLAIALHRVVVVRIHSGGVMYSGKLDRGSDEQAKQGVSFSPGCRRRASVEEEVGRGMIRVVKSGLDGGFSGGT